jgi:hypothetical protein
VANAVVVLKKDNRIKVCVDYKDLNKASSKEDFYLPYIDILVDSVVKSIMYSLMDGFSRYNHIILAEEN